MMEIDLHTHSFFSDGLYSPIQLLLKAKEKGCVLFSITDHDTIQGNIVLSSHLQDYSLTYINGVELSILINNKKFEVLGYNYDIHSLKLREKLMQLQNGRINRMTKIIEKLNDIGILVTLDEVKKEAAGAESIGRPHVARVMVKKGYVSSVKEAFDRYLAEGRPAYVKRRALSLKEAINLIIQAKGVAVVPHPLIFENKDLIKLEEILDMYVEAGAIGVEVYYDYKSNMPALPEKIVKKATKFMEQYCKKRGLIMRVGSDYHGDKGEVCNAKTPEEVKENLVNFFTKSNE